MEVVMDMIVKGLLSGLVAGALMGLCSEIGNRMNIFKSSLVVIGGAFLFKALRVNPHKPLIYLSGSIVHAATSVIFGTIYVIAMAIFRLNPLSTTFIALYVSMLWIFMLFVVLPVAGQGIMGKKIHIDLWREQLILHFIFGIGYYLALQPFTDA